MKDVKKTEARQGVTGQKVKLVLGISLAIAVVALVAVGIFVGGGD